MTCPDLANIPNLPDVDRGHVYATSSDTERTCLRCGHTIPRVEIPDQADP